MDRRDLIAGRKPIATQYSRTRTADYSGTTRDHADGKYSTVHPADSSDPSPNTSRDHYSGSEGSSRKGCRADAQAVTDTNSSANGSSDASSDTETNADHASNISSDDDYGADTQAVAGSYDRTDTQTHACADRATDR